MKNTTELAGSVTVKTHFGNSWWNAGKRDGIDIFVGENRVAKIRPGKSRFFATCDHKPLADVIQKRTAHGYRLAHGTKTGLESKIVTTLKNLGYVCA